MKTLTLETIILTYWGDIYMKRFFKLLRNVLLLALIALGVWTYQNNPNIRIATQDSLATLSYRINELLTNGTTISPNNEKRLLISKLTQIKQKMTILQTIVYGQILKLRFISILAIMLN